MTEAHRNLLAGLILATLAALLALLLGGCATRIDNGAFHFVTYSNAVHLTVSGPGIALQADGLNNSTPTSAAFRGASHFLAAAGTAALPFTGVPTAAKLAPVIPATIPILRTSP